MIPPQIPGRTPQNKEADAPRRPTISFDNDKNRQVIPNLEQLLGEKALIMNQNNYIGIHQSPEHLGYGCRDVNDLMQTYHGKFSSSYNSSDYACAPTNPMSVLAYIPEFKGFSHDFKQKDKPLVSTYE